MGQYGVLIQSGQDQGV